MSSRPREAPALGNGGTVDALPAGGLRRPTDVAMVANMLGPAVLALAVAATVTVAADHEGAYYVDIWGPLGLVLLAACAAVLAVRRAPSRVALVGAGASVAFGGWAVLSTLWGGIPNAAWTWLDQSLIAGAALFVGSAVATGKRGRTAVYAGVLGGLTAHAVWILAHVASNGGPASWYYQRYLEGPVGYHNAQATLFALGVPLALGAATSRRLAVRVVGAAALGPLVGALILTQSRGALLALGIATLVLLAWARDLRLLLFALPAAAVTGGMLLAVRSVDAALVEGTAAAHVDELRRYVVWCGVATVVLAAAAAVSAPSHSGRRIAVGLAVVALAAGGAAGVARTASIERALDRVTSGISDDSPDTAPAGATRLASLSLNGRRHAWRVAWMMARDHPVAGDGAGQFSRHWGTDRNIVYLYVLQPHSLELEIFGELGAVGVVLFAVLLVSAYGSTASGVSGRRRSAMAAAVLTALLAEVTVDWTWSFPAVVVPALLVVGAAGGGARLRRPRVTAAVTVPVVAVAAVALALPFLSDRQLDRGRALAAKNPNQAWDLSRAAQSLNPWDDRIYAFQGRLAGSAGLTALVVKKFDRSAELARQPWQRYFQEAGSLDPRNTKAVRRACLLARNADPLEPNIRYGPCNRVR